MCVTTETRPLDRLGQLGEFEQGRNTDTHSVCNIRDKASRPAWPAREWMCAVRLSETYSCLFLIKSLRGKYITVCLLYTSPSPRD